MELFEPVTRCDTVDVPESEAVRVGVEEELRVGLAVCDGDRVLEREVVGVRDRVDDEERDGGTIAARSTLQ